MKRLLSFALAAIMIIASLSVFVSAKEADEITVYEFSLAMDALAFYDTFNCRTEGNNNIADDFFYCKLLAQQHPAKQHDIQISE